jgi:hypothetical protein
MALIAEVKTIATIKNIYFKPSLFRVFEEEETGC